MATSIRINNLTKKFGNVVALDHVSLVIEPGTFVTLLGPSGCGKTTLLRCVAGLEDPDGGEIYIGIPGGSFLARWSGGRVAEGIGLLNRHRGLKLLSGVRIPPAPW